MQVRNGNVTLHVTEDGDPSARPIVLLHGIISSGRTWDWMVPDLAERHWVLRLDFRGHGQSDRTPNAYMPADYVADAVAVLEHVGRPCVVLGHSLGGATAAALTQQRPDLIVGAVMEDPPLGPRDPDESVSLEGNALLDGFRLMRQSIPTVQASNVPLDQLIGMLSAAPDTTGAGTFGDMLHPDALESMAAGLLSVDPTVLDPVLDGTMRSFLDPTVALGAPSLIIAADPSKPDAVADPKTAQHYAELSPDTEVLVVDGAGHLIHDERASRTTFVTAASSFIERLMHR